MIQYCSTMQPQQPTHHVLLHRASHHRRPRVPTPTNKQIHVRYSGKRLEIRNWADLRELPCCCSARSASCFIGRSFVGSLVGFPWSRFTVHRSPLTHCSLISVLGVHQRCFFVGFVLRGTARTHARIASVLPPLVGLSLLLLLPTAPHAWSSYESCIIHTNNVSHATQFPPSTVSPGLNALSGELFSFFCGRGFVVAVCVLL
ncbi:hypothetical protein BDD12DRAFT_389686 [Trichophaea hybrida]|nr:hypothetical protein BDD12DRAFT_389686 [Trichophaea hybrida]